MLELYFLVAWRAGTMRLVELLPDKVACERDISAGEKGQTDSSGRVYLRGDECEPAVLEPLLAAIKTHSVTQANQELEALCALGGDKEKLA